MRINVYNCGVNRIEHNQILRIERGKLQQLLEQERKLVETLISSFKRRIDNKLNLFASAEQVWKNIQNHNLLQSLRAKINCLTDAYPQFLQQVITARARLEQKMFAVLRADKFAYKTA